MSNDPCVSLVCRAAAASIIAVAYKNHASRDIDIVERDLGLHIELARLWAEAALVTRLNNGYGFADARIPAEVYLRDDDARERISRNSLRPRDSHLLQAQELARAIEQTTRALDSHTSSFSSLCERFHLRPAERALLTIALAYALDRDTRDLCHALAWRRRSALFADVCQDIAPELASARALFGALHPSGRLLAHELIKLDRAAGDANGLPGHRELSISRRVVDFLLGEQRLAGSVRTAVQVMPIGYVEPVYVPPAVERDVERVAQHLARDRDNRHDNGGRPADPCTLVLIQGALGAGKRAVAQLLASKLHCPLAEIRLASVINAMRRDGALSLMRDVLAEVALRGALAYLPDSDILDQTADGQGRDDRVAVALDALYQYDDALVLATTERRMPAPPVQRPFHLIRMPSATLEIRRNAWAKGLAAIASRGEAIDDALSPDIAEQFAARYVIGPGTVSDVLADAQAFARATARAVERADIESAVGRRLSMRLGSFGTVISRRASMDEMVLPDDVIETLQDMIAMVKERTQILERWGYSQHLGLNRGVSGLFSGEPGTGKTMAASVISGALGLELIRIDLSSVTSKWVGETEKHLAKIFDEAQTANAMLLFDEADSLFGKRTKLESAQDRYANLEVNYVLQRMEAFDGVCVLTTNFESAIDAAFLRRLNFRVRFPKPEFEERLLLWKRLLPPDTGLTTDDNSGVDFHTLAHRFAMTGGHIRNAIVRAAVVAARQGRAMRPEDLFAGALHEYAEMGKVMTSL